MFLLWPKRLRWFGDWAPASVPPSSLPLPPKSRSSPTNSSLFPPTFFVLLSFSWLYIFFSGGHVSCPLSAGVLQALLCLKVYYWCICGDMYSTSFYFPTILFSPLSTGFLFLLDSVMVGFIFLKIIHFFNIIQFMHIWTHWNTHL